MLQLMGLESRLYVAKVASTRCPICSVKCKVIDPKTIYCTIHGYMDRIYDEVKGKDVKH